MNRSLGIYRIAHFLREHGLDVEVIDWATSWTLEQLQTLIRSREPSKIGMIGFSHVFSHWTGDLEQLCQWLRKTYPHIKTVSGSSGAPYFKSNDIDYYVEGYGEHAVLALSKYIMGNGSRPRFNLAKINGAHIIQANDAYPAFPMRNLMVRYEDRDFLEPNEWLMIEFARGCRFSCKFCNFPILGVKEDHTRDPEDFRHQVQDAYDRFGITNYLVADETFNDYTEKITRYADVVETLPFQPWFGGYIRADLLIHRGQAELDELLRMNFLGHFYGVETFNHRAGSVVGKGMDSDRLKQGLIDIRNQLESTEQYRGTLSLIAGLPHETLEDLENTRQWLIQHWQGQSFVMNLLEIYKDQWIKPSKFTVDYKKYGYTDMLDPPSEPPKTLLHSYSATAERHLDTTMRWQNEHMDIYQADDMVMRFANTKEDHDFRVSTFRLGSRFHSAPTLADRLAIIPHNKEKNHVTSSVDRYIERKLNHRIE